MYRTAVHTVNAYHSPPAETNWNNFSQLHSKQLSVLWKVSIKFVKTILVPNLLAVTLGFLTHHLTAENLDRRRQPTLF